MSDTPEATVRIDTGGGTRRTAMTGTFADACKLVWAMPADRRALASIVTPEWTYTAAEVEGLRMEDEGEV